MEQQRSEPGGGDAAWIEAVVQVHLPAAEDPRRTQVVLQEGTCRTCSHRLRWNPTGGWGHAPTRSRCRCAACGDAVRSFQPAPDTPTRFYVRRQRQTPTAWPGQGRVGDVGFVGPLPSLARARREHDAWQADGSFTAQVWAATPLTRRLVRSWEQGRAAA